VVGYSNHVEDFVVWIITWP